MRLRGGLEGRVSEQLVLELVVDLRKHRVGVAAGVRATVSGCRHSAGPGGSSVGGRERLRRGRQLVSGALPCAGRPMGESVGAARDAHTAQLAAELRNLIFDLALFFYLCGSIEAEGLALLILPFDEMCGREKRQLSAGWCGSIEAVVRAWRRDQPPRNSARTW